MYINIRKQNHIHNQKYSPLIKLTDELRLILAFSGQKYRGKWLIHGTRRHKDNQ